MNDKIRCCGAHGHYPVPVLPSVKWRGKEWWCPFCGQTYEFFDGFKYYEPSEELEKRREMLSELANDFLSDKTEYFELYQKPDIMLSEGAAFNATIDERTKEVSFSCAHCPTVIFKEVADFDVARDKLPTEEWQKQMFNFLTKKAAHLIHNGKLLRVCPDCLKQKYIYAPTRVQH